MAAVTSNGCEQLRMAEGYFQRPIATAGYPADAATLTRPPRAIGFVDIGQQVIDGDPFYALWAAGGDVAQLSAERHDGDKWGQSTGGYPRVGIGSQAQVRPMAVGLD